MMPLLKCLNFILQKYKWNTIIMNVKVYMKQKLWYKNYIKLHTQKSALTLIEHFLRWLWRIKFHFLTIVSAYLFLQLYWNIIDEKETVPIEIVPLDHCGHLSKETRPMKPSSQPRELLFPFFPSFLIPLFNLFLPLPVFRQLLMYFKSVYSN